MLDDLLLQVECRSDNVDCVMLEVTTECSGSSVHGDQLLQFGPTVHDAVMGTENELKQLGDGPRNDTLYGS